MDKIGFDNQKYLSLQSEKILEREIKTSDHKKIIDSFIAEIGEGDE